MIKEIRTNLNKSDKIDLKEKASFVLKGYLFFYENDLDQSNNYFDNAKETDPNYVPCIFGRACIEYAKKNYTEALKLYKTALRLNPNGAPEMRLGLGYCYYQLDNIDLSLKSFESVLSRDPMNIQAMIAIAVISRKMERFERYYDLIEKAYQLKPND
jgi:RNA polymerase-associated protein CTR9